MLKTTFSAIAALTISTLPLSAFAGESGSYSYWKSEHGDAISYAIQDTATDKAVSATTAKKGLKIATGDAAKAVIAELKSNQPNEHKFVIKDNEDMHIITGDDTQIKVIELDSDDPETLQRIMEENGIEVDLSNIGEPDSSKDHKIIIKKMSDENSEMEIDIDSPDLNEDGSTKMVRKEIIIERDEEIMPPPGTPSTPEAPETPGTKVVKKIIIKTDNEDEASEQLTEQITEEKSEVMDENVWIEKSSSSKSKYEYRFDNDDGDVRNYTFVSGASAEEAKKFIKDIKGISRKERKQMYAALGL
ncbi:MAG: hypothetical protein ACWA5L_04890 [bacterium]